MRIHPRAKMLPGPTPLIALVDVVFLLLIFFMISSSLVFWPGTPVETNVNLPRSRTSNMRAADKLVVTMTRSGRVPDQSVEILYYFGDEPVSWDELERKLNEAVRELRETARLRQQVQAADPQAATEPPRQARSPLVVLRADRNIPYGKIVEVMSLARSLDLGVYLVTEPLGEARPRTLLPIGVTD